jgi:hypothetical protein
MALITTATLISGCSGPIEKVNREGPAAEEALAWYGDILMGDLEGAHGRLHPAAARKVSRATFDKKCKAMVSSWNLTSPQVVVTSSQERTDSATVHIAIRGMRSGHGKRITGGVTLKPDGGRWKIWMVP